MKPEIKSQNARRAPQGAAVFIVDSFYNIALLHIVNDSLICKGTGYILILVVSDRP